MPYTTIKKSVNGIMQDVIDYSGDGTRVIPEAYLSDIDKKHMNLISDSVGATFSNKMAATTLPNGLNATVVYSHDVNDQFDFVANGYDYEYEEVGVGTDRVRIYTISGAVTDILSLPDFDPAFPRVTVTTSFFDDIDLTTPSTGVTGTIDVDGLVYGEQEYSALVDSPLDVSIAGGFASAAAPFSDIRVTPTGIANSTHYQVTVVAHAS